ncbi:hypothetical protein [uncultured Turicimonas sp.]|uniref:hypothetical protein n=1 Tax=uncultured Turicimonas sp. TaxID=1918607 RepID=UPI0028054FE1|nr:hypothetical protein [uncultured Turicimonas sp.]
MFNFLRSWRVSGIIILLLLLSGFLAGKFLSREIKEISLVTYGYIAFAILPITICLFGLKELNSAYSQLGSKLNKREREVLETILYSKTKGAILWGFLLVLLQVVLAFMLSVFQSDIEWFFAIWGALLGATVAVLVYGLSLCLSVQEIYSFVNQTIDSRIRKEQSKDLENRLSNSTSLEA